MPTRVCFNRNIGGRLPPGSRLIARARRPHDLRRSNSWGNWVSWPQEHTPEAHRRAVEEYRAWAYADEPEAVLWRERVRQQLRGWNLACTCPPGWPCHGDVLLEIANQTEPTP
jgi:hypothetical protein